MIGQGTPSSAGIAVSLRPSIVSARQIPKPKQTPHPPPKARILPFYPFLDLLLPSLLASAAVLPLVPAAVAAAYPCETPTSYYSPADGLKGAALKKRLSSIISPHHSISYKKVWDALKILDAADVDNPEDSSQVIEIYSLRSVAKELAGKPEGWNKSREMGLLSALLQWNELDPPSRAEQLRNDRICGQYQHNRNPFVDHPEYANLIWKHDSQSSIMDKFDYDNKGKRSE